MRRRTQRFIDKNMGGRRSFIQKFSGKQIAVFVSIVVVALVASGLYLWYSMNYGNARKITLESRGQITYEWQKIAADNNLVSGYLFSKTQKLMLKNNTLIPTSYTIAGRLVSQNEYASLSKSLSDQAMLLKAYVKSGDRSSAVNLKNRILETFMSDSGLLVNLIKDNEKDYVPSVSVSSNLDFLEAYLEYYSVYGSNQDLEQINKFVDLLFDSEGYLKPEHIVVASYVDKEYVSSESYDDEIETPSLEQVYGADSKTEESAKKEFDGVKLSDVRLLLIKNLENNDFLPEKSYENNLKIVLDGRISDSIQYYSFAYTMGKDGPEYIYSAYNAGTISVSDSVLTMKNLSQVKALPNDIYTMFKSELLNDSRISESYYIVTGTSGGNEAIDVYDDVIIMALYQEDTVLFDKVTNMVGSRVASKSTSPALYMIYRNDNDRYNFYASENLGIWLAIS